MSETESFDRAWAAYQGAVAELYAAPSGLTETVERGAGEIYSERLEARGSDVLQRAEEVRGTLEESLKTETLDIRELATLKMLAAAAYDLSLAHDIIEMEAAGPEAEPERGARGAILADRELRAVLDAPLDQGVSALIEAERAVLPKDPAKARERLEETLAVFVAEIPKSAATLSQSAVIGIAIAGLVPAKGVLESLAANKMIALIPEGVRRGVRLAAKVVVEAIKKVRAALGKDVEEHAQEKVNGWLKDIRENRDTVQSLLDKLYETPRIHSEVADALAGYTSPDAEPYNDATRTLEALIAHYEKTKSVLEKVMWFLKRAQTLVLPIVPWGPVAVYSAYLGILTYAVFSGGDYLDWYRTGEIAWLDRVEGLRTTVQHHLTTTT